MRIVVAVIVWLLAVAALCGLTAELYRQRQDFLTEAATATEEINARLDVLNEKFDDVMVPPTKDRIYDILTRGLAVAEAPWKTDTANATPEAAFATDLTTAQKTDAYVQQIIIRNASADVTPTNGDLLCWATIAWNGVVTCQNTCAASAAIMTCSGASTDGMHIGPGSEVARRLDGTSCVCIIGTAGVTEYQTQRSVR